MWYRWDCGGCDHTAWSRDAATLETELRSHLRTHYRRKRADDNAQYSWACPYCGTSGVTYMKSDAGDAFENHLSGHVPGILESTDVTDVLRTSDQLLLYARERDAAAAAMRKHVFYEADSLLVVTGSPDERLRILSEELPSPPRSTTVLTTASPPYEHADAGAGRIDVARLDGGIGLTELASEISTVIDEYEARGTFYVEFDIAGAILDRFGVEAGFKFINALNAWARNAGAGIYYPVSPARQPESVLNVVEGLFDRSVHARGDLLVSSSAASPKG